MSRSSGARPGVHGAVSQSVNDRLSTAIAKLDDSQRALVLQMAEAMAVAIASKINSESDLATERFSISFSNQLLLHHATHEEKLNKKSFEYLLKAACEMDGRTAILNVDPTNAAEDVRVDNVKFSLKTEAAAGMRDGALNIQKLMEARWIRDYDTREDLAREAAKRIGRHLGSYERILVLRAFDQGRKFVRYELVEIPKALLMRISTLRSSDLEDKNEKGGCGANVKDENGHAFRLFLDGSVEKVRIFSLRKDRCVVHGEWTIPRPVPSASASEEG